MVHRHRHKVTPVHAQETWERDEQPKSACAAGAGRGHCCQSWLISVTALMCMDMDTVVHVHGSHTSLCRCDEQHEAGCGKVAVRCEVVNVVWQGDEVGWEEQH
jgi:hypothetical protein